MLTEISSPGRHVRLLPRRGPECPRLGRHPLELRGVGQLPPLPPAPGRRKISSGWSGLVPGEEIIREKKTFQEWYPGNFFKVSFAGIWKIWSVSRFGNEKEKSEDV
jgi:hypothetical protein